MSNEYYVLIKLNISILYNRFYYFIKFLISLTVQFTISENNFTELNSKKYLIKIHIIQYLTHTNIISYGL